MASTATITAKIGAAVTATAVVLSNVTGITFDPIGGTFSIFQAGGAVPKIFDLSGVTTITMTISGINLTLTMT